MSYAAKHLDGIVDISIPNKTSAAFSSDATVDKTENGERNKISVLNINGIQHDDFIPTSPDESNFPGSSGGVEEVTEINIPVPWGHISAKTWGSSKGYPMLGLHGWMDNCGTFDRLSPLLPKSIYFVAVDLPGHGFSSHYPVGTPYHYSDFLTAIRRITNFFKWTKFIMIGHSMGAGLGALYASIFPSQVERLVMLDLVKPITGETSNYSVKIAMAIDHYLSIEEKLKPSPPTYSYEDACERLVKATDDSLSEDAAKVLLARGARRVSENEWAFTRDIRLRSPTLMRFSHEQCFTILKEIKCSTMIIKATDAPWFEKEEICKQALDIYRKSCKSFTYIEVPGNHFVHLNEPEKIADKINRFLLEQKSAL